MDATSKSSDTGLKFVSALLDKKADQMWAESEFSSIREGLKDIRRKSTDMERDLRSIEKRSVHICLKEGEWEDMKKWKTSLSNIKIATVISIIVLISGVIAQYFSLKTSVVLTAQKIEDVQITVSSLKETQAQLKETVDAQSAIAEERRREGFEELKDLVISALGKTPPKTKSKKYP